MPANPNNYDAVAAYYDRLSMLIFGRSLRRAQEALLAVIKPGDHILIVGGGTGWILEAMAARVPAGLEITYVELSGKMTAIARTKNVGANVVHFVNASITEQVLPDAHFDIVFTAFLFDNFLPDDALRLFAQLDRSLKSSGHWLFADFDVVKAEGYWQKTLLQLMYFFFRKLCHVQARQLNDMETIFAQHHFAVIAERRFFGRFVLSVIYKRALKT